MNNRLVPHAITLARLRSHFLLDIIAIKVSAIKVSISELDALVATQKERFC